MWPFPSASCSPQPAQVARAHPTHRPSMAALRSPSHRSTQTHTRIPTSPGISITPPEGEDAVFPPPFPVSPGDEELPRLPYAQGVGGGDSTSKLVDGGAPILNGTKWKGKGRAVGEVPGEDADADVDTENSGMAIGEEGEVELARYPPLSDDAQEERKIAENLKRWELAERQRRKSMRDARHRDSTASLSDTVTRRASLLWRGARKRPSVIGGPGDRSSVNSGASDAPLRPEGVGEDVSPTTPTTPFTPRSSDGLRNVSSASSQATARPDPFATPNANSSPTSRTRVASEPTPRARMSFGDPFSSSSSLDHSQDRALPALPETEIEDDPPPQRDVGVRFDLHRAESSNASDAPSTVKWRTDEEAELAVGEGAPRERRWWWIDWLCGCGGGEEDDDEDQAGRTNPFE